MPFARSSAAGAFGALLAASTLAGAQVAAPAKGALPIKLAAKPTAPAISPADLMSRVYIFADDSLMGRQVGTEYNLKGTAYIEREVRRIGLLPAGENGGYFQSLPLFSNYTDSTSSLRIGDQTLKGQVDYLAIPRAARSIAFEGKPVVYVGTNTDSTTWPTAEAVAGKVILLTVPATASPFRGTVFPSTSRFAGASAVLVAALDRFPANVIPQLARSTALRPADAPAPGPTTLFITTRTAGLLMGSADSLKPGATGKSLTGTIILREERAPGNNVIAILPGSDPRLKGQYVAIGAHNDHVGFRQGAVDHDSVKAYVTVARPQGEDSPSNPTLTPAQISRIRAMTDSLRKLHGAPRPDSIYNGADDDASGSMSVLEIAESLAGARVKPKRSILFVWHTGEEAGLYGSQHFTDNPTVPRDSIVAQLNMDMVGRGGANDITGEKKEGGLLRGGPGYLQLVGSRRLSTELGDLIEAVNKENKLGFNFDYGIDANGHPQNIYCRSDHYEYARYGIPVTFFTTGGHADYHQVTDEPQYLDYDRMAQVATLVRDVATKVANLDHRVVVDKPKPDPKGRCVQ
jgi:hypothetical protein